jgi:hypothetical protein
MRHSVEKLIGGCWPARIDTRRGAIALATVAAALGAAPPALAASKNKELFAKFADCPIHMAAVCVVSYTTGGEFVIGNKAVPIEKTVTLQGGLETSSFEQQSLLGATDSDTLSQTPLTVPGGLLGIAGLGGEVTATAELAGPASSVTIDRRAIVFREPSVTLPIKVKLSNPILGEECYIGSEADPIVLHLTTGTTSPPAPGKPISGSVGSGEQGLDKGKIQYIEATIVDNDFAVPGAKGCGGALSPIVDPIVDLDVGIPAAAGKSSAVMKSTLYETKSEYAAKYIPKEKKSKK